MNVHRHKKKVTRIAQKIKEYQKASTNKKIRFTHGSTNSTRVQAKEAFHLIDISTLDEVIEIDTRNKLAIVEPNVPMDKLVDACLAKGFIPKVVMEFPGITCGGGVNGGALEASSFRYGQFNDICTAYELILGNGELVYASKNKNTDLYYGVSGSYGTFALLTRITLELIPAKSFIHVSFHPVETDSIIRSIVKDFSEYEYDYLEGIVFDENNALVLTGQLTNGELIEKLPCKTFSKAIDDWFYLYAEKQLQKDSITEVLIPVKDYLFRYDRGAFWMGKHAFSEYHIPFNRITRFLLNPFMNARTMYKGLHATNIAQDFFIQDFYLPLSSAQKFLNKSIHKSGIFPVWICPLKATKTEQKLSPHFLSERTIIDIGLWGKAKGRRKILEVNKEFEKHLKEYGGRKMFYADSFYSEQEFWKIYDKKWYENLRKKYKADGIFPTIREKVYTKKRYVVQKRKIIKPMIKALLNVLIR
jgi:delta24-sterol reductase